MNILTVCALVCTIVALAGSAERKAESNETGNTHLIKRSLRCGGWYQFRRRCYYYVAARLSWARAERYCRYLGGNLASVHNYVEYYVLQRLILRYSYSYRVAWIGGSDAQQEGYWFWSDGSNFRYTNWCYREPNNAGGRQHCLQMNYSGRKCWDDDMCYVRKPFVCVKKLR